MGKRKNLEKYTILKSMKPVKGEVRSVYKCSDCGQLFGRRYVPYGLGEGLSVNMCMCQLTNRTPFTKVLETSP